jgi:hypothetical protein
MVDARCLRRPYFPGKVVMGASPVSVGRDRLTEGDANMMLDSDYQMNARPASSVDESLDPTRNLDWIAAAVHPD